MTDQTRNLELAAALTSAWLGNPHTRPHADDVPTFLRSMHDALGKLAPTEAGQGGHVDRGAADQAYTPAVSVRQSLASPDYIVSMINGKPYKALRRHLTSNGLTPDQYRARYGLKANYPMVAASYSAARSETAKRLGLGRKPGQKVGRAAAPTTTSEASEPKQPKRRKPKSISEAKAAAAAHLGTGQ